MIGNFIKYTKETLVAKWIDSKIKDYGSVLELVIDTVNKIVSINVMLKGENSALTITIENYKILKEPDGTYFCIEHIVTNREWINLFIQNHFETILPQRKIKFPNRIVKNIIKILL